MCRGRFCSQTVRGGRPRTGALSGRGTAAWSRPEPRAVLGTQARRARPASTASVYGPARAEIARPVPDQLIPEGGHLCSPCRPGAPSPRSLFDPATRSSRVVSSVPPLRTAAPRTQRRGAATGVSPQSLIQCVRAGAPARTLTRARVRAHPPSHCHTRLLGRSDQISSKHFVARG